jgi:hypothetical protein
MPTATSPVQDVNAKPKAKARPKPTFQEVEVRVLTKPFVSVLEAAVFLGIAKSTAYLAAASGLLCEGVPVTRVRRRFLVATRDLRRVAGEADGQAVTP